MMKQRIIAVLGILVLLAGILLSACSKAKEEKILVAYFSATGNTKAVATQLADETGADLFEIVPKEAYTTVQLGYDDPEQRVTKEQADDSCRVEIDGTVDNFKQYSTIYIGYPIWYGKAPRIILTFLESYDFDGKTIIPFCTSDNDGIEAGLEELKQLAPTAEWQDGQRFDGAMVTASLDAEGTITDETIKAEIAAFAEKTSPNAAANQTKQENGSTTKSHGSEEAPFEEGTDNAEGTSATGASGNSTTTTAAAASDAPTAPSSTAPSTTEPTTETTTLGAYETPYIPIG